MQLHAKKGDRSSILMPFLITLLPAYLDFLMAIFFLFRIDFQISYHPFSSLSKDPDKYVMKNRERIVFIKPV
jgi:hypothetical protein